ncbi:MAG: YfcC family protein [Bacteroidales bacterium]|jgi:uncharacterized ion transporter superfamily protein YfcC|nr:YfcC family protein [Bacteroidales bacterium]
MKWTDKIKIPNTFTIVFIIVVVAAVATWLVPSGEFIRQTVVAGDSQKEIVVPDSYHRVENSPQTWQIFSAFFNGFVKTSNIIIFILIIGGAFWIFNHTQAIDRGVVSFLKIMEKIQHKKVFKHFNINALIIVCIMLMFSLFGAVFGMSEETIAFVVIFIPLSISMGYDSIVGMCMCYLAAHVGFTGAMLNPFTIGIAQGLSDLPAFSGLGYRAVCWLIFTAIGILFVLWYARKIKKNPQCSPMYKLDDYWRNKEKNVEKQTSNTQKSPLSAWLIWGILLCVFGGLTYLYPSTEIAVSQSVIHLPLFAILTVLFFVIGLISLRKNVQMFILNLLLFTVLCLIIGVLGYQWYIGEISALFLGMGICAGIAYKCSLNQIFKLFLEGCKDIMNAALVVGMAGGIIIILQDGKIIDTLLYAMSDALKGIDKTGSLAMMYLFQNALNLIIPSGSAKAALTIPIMAQFADMLHLSRQSMVLAFQFGDGITNMLTPASGVLLGCLGMARIPYTIWVKWIWKFLLFLLLLGFALLVLTLFIPLTGF